MNQYSFSTILILLFVCFGCKDESNAPSTIVFDDHPVGTVPNAVASYQLNECNWDVCTLNYFIQDSYKNSFQLDEIKSIYEWAFEQWAIHTGLQFSEVQNEELADITLLHESIDNVGGRLGYAFYPCAEQASRKGNIIIDADEQWTTSERFDKDLPFDIYTVVLHEIGHSLGLEHTNIEEAVMYAEYQGSKRQLHSDDIGGIRQLYDCQIDESENEENNNNDDIACMESHPNPVLSFIGSEVDVANGTSFVRYSLKVENHSAYPNDFFETTSEYGPCGANATPSRTWVRIYNASDEYIYGFCAFKHPSNLEQIWFGGEVGALPPDGVYIRLNDRRCAKIYTSNLVYPTYPNTSNANLTITHAEITSITTSSVQYNFTIKNTGDIDIDLDGKIASPSDNISIQAFLSDDEIFNNHEDSAAGGTVLTMSNIILLPNQEFKGSFGASTFVNPFSKKYLILKVDWGEVLAETNEGDNFYIMSI